MEYFALKFVNITEIPEEIKVTGIPPGGLDTASKVIRNGLTIFIIISLILTIIILLWAAIDWLSSGGDKQKVQTARMKITYAIIGLVVVFSAFFIINFLGYLFRVPLTGQ